MTRRYRAFRFVIGNGHTEAQAAEALGVTAATVSRDLAALARRYPGLECAFDLCKRVHRGEGSLPATSQSR